MDAGDNTHGSTGEPPIRGTFGISTAYRVAFPVRGEVRAEVEQAPYPFSGWWRARVCGGTRWVVPRPMPWSYGPSETVAVDAAVSLWAIAGQPRFEGPTDELPLVSQGFAAGATEARPLPPSETADSGAAVVVLARPGRKTPVERQALGSVNHVLRAFIDAFECGAPTLTLTGRSGNPIEVELSSVLELREGRRATPNDARPEYDDGN